MHSLFDDTSPDTTSGDSRPLAERMRPVRLEDFVGQAHLLAVGTPLRAAIEQDRIPSMILWGPPGVGKTTIARIIATTTEQRFQDFSAVLAGIRELRNTMDEARRTLRSGVRTILFVDEIHRFNKAQQDAFLPWVEDGTITLIGATTENPSFEVNRALLSRLRVFVLDPLSDEDIGTLVQRACAAAGRRLSPDACAAIVAFASGDARAAYNVLELAFESAHPETALTGDLVREIIQRKPLQYDKSGEEHFNTISALHKSIRNSDADAGLYWLARMLEAGEDPLYVARRLVRFASEDVGLAAPQALRLALDAKDAAAFVGMPEASLALAQCVVYLASAPKSNSVYRAYNAVREEVRSGPTEPVPLHLRNAPTRLMRDLDYGKGYAYAHDTDGGVADMECLPERLLGRRFYRGKSVGFEEEVVRRLEEARNKKRSTRK